MITDELIEKYKGQTKKANELIKKYKIEIKEAMLDLKTPGRIHRQIPNILTCGRLLSPLVIIPTALSGNTETAIKLAAIFGATDFIDGFIARTWNLTSPLGADLDALTDKVFVGTLLLTGAISNPYLLVNTGLEGTIAGINLKQKISGNNSGSTNMGKIKTGAVFTLGSLGVVASSVQELDKVILPLAISTAILQTMTIASYRKKYSSNDDKKLSELNEDETTLLGQLKKESNFLHQELDNIQGQDLEEPLRENDISPSHQKIKI